MNLVVFDVDGTLIQSTGVDDECFARAIEAAWRISNISTQWDDYEHVTDTGIASELFQKHFGRESAPAALESLQQEFVNQSASPVSGTSIPQTAGAAELLQRLQRHEFWRAAIATGSWARAIDFKLQAACVSLASPLSAANTRRPTLYLTSERFPLTVRCEMTRPKSEAVVVQSGQQNVDAVVGFLADGVAWSSTALVCRPRPSPRRNPALQGLNNLVCDLRSDLSCARHLHRSCVCDWKDALAGVLVLGASKNGGADDCAT